MTTDKTPAATVADLIRLLQTMPPDAAVCGYCEGMRTVIDDVILHDGCVHLDMDSPTAGSFLRDLIDEGEA